MSLSSAVGSDVCNACTTKTFLGGVALPCTFCVAFASYRAEVR